MIPKAPEKAIQKAILDYLKLRQIFCWRNNTGARKFDYRRKGDGKVTHNFFQWGKAGSGDILGMLKDGRFFSIEVKAVGKKASESQEEFMAEVRKNQGIAFVAYSVDDVAKNLP